MSLEEKVMAQIKDAMRAKDEVALRTLRAIKAAILIEKTSASAKDTLSETDEFKLLQKMAKQRKDSLDIFTQQNRPDLAKKEEEELQVLSQFLPQALSEEALKTAVSEIISSTGATTAADMGKVMGVATKKLAGRAEGKAISDMVKSLLSAS